MQFSFTRAGIRSLGYTLPETIVTSDEIEERLAPLYERLKLPAGRLELMTGISERRFWPVDTLISDLSAISCRRALAAANVDPRDVGLLIHGSVCRDFLEPATACRVHHLSGLPPECQVYDVSNACLGILNGIIQAANMIELGQINYALVVGTESGRGLVDTTIDELNTNTNLTRKSIKHSIASLTIGSASCAVLLGLNSEKSGSTRVIGGVATANTRHNELCRSSGDTAGGIASPLMETDSEALMHEGVETGRRTFHRFLEHMGWSREEISATVCHQVGSTHRKLMLESVAMPDETDFVTYPILGNTGSAALPVTLARAIETRAIGPGQKVALMGIGSGINCLVLGIETAATPVVSR